LALDSLSEMDVEEALIYVVSAHSLLKDAQKRMD